MAITLKFLAGPLKEKVLTFNKEAEIVFGRKEGCDVVLNDPKMSGEHCGIFYENGKYVLEDFDSTNGTYVNTTKVKGEIDLNNGDTVLIGASRITVKIESSVSAQKQPQQSAAKQPQLTKTPIKAPVEEEATNIKKTNTEIELDDDTNVKKVKRPKGIKQLLNPDFYIDAKENFISFSTPKKAAIILVVVLFIGIIVFALSGSKSNVEGDGIFGPSDNSEEVYPLDKSAGKLRGYYKSRTGGSGDLTHPNKVKLSFPYEEGTKIIVIYSIADIEYFDEVIVKLNDLEIAKAPITTEGTPVSQKLQLPIEGLKAKDNILEFVNTRNLGADGKKEKWALIIDKVEVKILPKPDYNLAKDNYVLAEKFFNQKKIYRGNLFKAFGYYEKAKYFMELMPNKPDFFNDCNEKMKIIDQELWDMYKDAMYMAKRNIDFKDYAKAEEYVYKIIEEIPNEADSRYLNASNLLTKLSRYTKRK